MNRKINFCFLLLSTLLSASCSNEPSADSKIEAKDLLISHRIKNNSDTILVTEHIDFKKRVQLALQYLVDQDGVRGTNNFYIEKIIVDSLGHYYCPWVYYKEKNEIILFEPRTSDIMPFKDLELSRRRLDLDKDIVPTEADIKGSTYLETQAWKDEKLKSCLNGSHFVIEKK